MKRKKIAVIGGGNVGGTVASFAAMRELCDIVLIDTPEREGIIRGKALDIVQACSLFNNDVEINASSSLSDVAGADICIVTAGIPRKPGMSRNDLFDINLDIIGSVAEAVANHAPESFVIVVANPLDAMTYAMLKLTGFGWRRVVGMAGLLDSARLQYFISCALGCSVKDVKALVLGGHGDDMVPVLSYCSVNGVPVRNLLDEDSLQKVVGRTRDGGSEIVKLMGASGYYAAAISTIITAESYLKDQKRFLPCSVLLQGEYSITNICMGAPVIIGGEGVGKIVELSLSPSELSQLKNSAKKLKGLASRVDTRAREMHCRQEKK
jgi:malate dehydrogenase